MITLSTTARELHHHIRLNAEFRSDLQWWSAFLEWLVVAFRSWIPSLSYCQMHCGGSNDQWFQIKWSELWSSVKEFLLCAVWGRKWQIRVRCDNAALVAILWSKNNLTMEVVLFHSLFSYPFDVGTHSWKAWCWCWFVAFASNRYPAACQTETVVPEELCQVIIHQQQVHYEAQFYFSIGLASSTKSGSEFFLKFCQENNVSTLLICRKPGLEA